MPKKPSARGRSDAARRCRGLYRLIRERLGDELSDREIARRWGMEWKSFAALKHGQRQVPRIDELERLAAVLELPAADVFFAASSVARERPASAAPADALALALDRVPDALFTIDAGGRIHDFNRALPRLTGRSASELRDRSLLDLVGVESAARALACIAAATRDGQASDAEVVLLGGASAPRTVMLHATPVHDGAGVVVGAQLIAREVTATRQPAGDRDERRGDLRVMPRWRGDGDGGRRAAAERRGSPRAESAFVVKYRYRRRLREATVENFGHGGLFIRTDERLSQGAKLELEWRLPGDNAPMRATAVVAWSRAASTEAPAGIGVRFVAVG
jgi:uncharacterized protein (TIGR02266 family)